MYRMQPERRLRPSESHLASEAHYLLITRYAPFDVLGTIGERRRYEDIEAQTTAVEACGQTLRLLDLRAIIAEKERRGGEKELAVLPVLRRTLEEAAALKARAPAKSPPSISSCI